MNDAKTTLSDLKRSQDAFLAEREWHQFHNPMVDSTGPVGEAGELLELFVLGKFGEGGRDVLLKKRGDVEDEVADVIMWLVMFSNSAQIDITSALQKKLGLSVITDDTKMTVAELMKLSAPSMRWKTPLDAAKDLSWKVACLMQFFLESGTGNGQKLAEQQKEQVEKLLADAFGAALEFVSVSEFDLSTAFANKREKNAQKYSVEKSKGKPNKYNDL